MTLKTTRNMLFVDAAAVTSHTMYEHLMDRISQACNDFGLTISLKKTTVLSQDVGTPPTICIDDNQLKVVHQFTYLGSTIIDNLSLDTNSTLIYGSETWPTCSKQEHKLNNVHLHFLRRILGISLHKKDYQLPGT